MTEPSPGDVTFLFTNVEGSTARWEQDEAATRRSLAAHDAIVRHAVARHHGMVFAAVGDGLSAMFTHEASAVRCAVAAQARLARLAWPDGSPPQGTDGPAHGSGP